MTRGGKSADPSRWRVGCWRLLRRLPGRCAPMRIGGGGLSSVRATGSVGKIGFPRLLLVDNVGRGSMARRLGLLGLFRGCIPCACRSSMGGIPAGRRQRCRAGACVSLAAGTRGSPDVSRVLGSGRVFLVHRSMFRPAVCRVVSDLGIAWVVA